MQRSFNLVLVLFSLVVVYFSFSTFDTLARLQVLVNRLNEGSQNQVPTDKDGGQSAVLSEFEQLFDQINWDADVGSMLIQVINNQVNQTSNKGRQQSLLSKAQTYYQHSLSFRPRDIQLLSGKIDLLIDQGAPADYILPQLDEIIVLVPKDQDLKAELAMICFKLLALNPQPSVQSQIIKRLQSLFKYSMDYRGLIHVRRYAKLYGQEEVLKSILSTQN